MPSSVLGVLERPAPATLPRPRMLDTGPQPSTPRPLSTARLRATRCCKQPAATTNYARVFFHATGINFTASTTCLKQPTVHAVACITRRIPTPHPWANSLSHTLGWFGVFGRRTASDRHPGCGNCAIKQDAFINRRTTILRLCVYSTGCQLQRWPSVALHCRAPGPGPISSYRV